MRKKTRAIIIYVVTAAILFTLLLLMYKCLIFPTGHEMHMGYLISGIPAYLSLAVIDLLFKTGFIIVILRFILPSFTKQRKIARLYFLFVITLLLFFIVEIQLKAALIPVFHLMHIWGHIPVGLISLFLYIIIASVLIINYLIKQWINNEKQKRALIESQLTNELNFLKAQINPHFIFNSLNALFSISQKYKVEELESGILKLSGLMRYSLYENNNQLVTIEKEIKYIEDYIGLFKLRYPGEELTVIFKTSGNVSDIYIAPMIFLPFVENAFKYGVSMQKKSIIEISIAIENRVIVFLCSNEVVRNNNDETITDKGLGLINVKRRLELLYPQKHVLTINHTDEKFKVILQINTAL